MGRGLIEGINIGGLGGVFVEVSFSEWLFETVEILGWDFQDFIDFGSFLRIDRGQQGYDVSQFQVIDRCDFRGNQVGFISFLEQLHSVQFQTNYAHSVNVSQQFVQFHSHLIELGLLHLQPFRSLSDRIEILLQKAFGGVGLRSRVFTLSDWVIVEEVGFWDEERIG